MGMDLRTLEYFTVVARELNISRAAEKLAMSQPPLSSQMKNLEEDLGVILFKRGKRRLTLTEAGAHLLHRAEQILELADKTRNELQNMKSSVSGNICLGTVEGRAPFLAARWIAGFREEYPLVTFSLRNGGSDDVVQDMKRGLVDVALIARPFDRVYLDGIRVARDPWIAIIPEDHPLARQEGDTIPLSSLSGVPLIVPDRPSRIESIRRWFAGIQAEPDIIANTANYVDAVALVEANAGISIFPVTSYIPAPGTIIKQISSPAKAIEYDLVWPKDPAPTELVREFINYVTDTLEDAGANKKEALPDVFTAPESAGLL